MQPQISGDAPPDQTDVATTITTDTTSEAPLDQTNVATPINTDTTYLDGFKRGFLNTSQGRRRQPQRTAERVTDAEEDDLRTYDLWEITGRHGRFVNPIHIPSRATVHEALTTIATELGYRGVALRDERFAPLFPPSEAVFETWIAQASPSELWPPKVRVAGVVPGGGPMAHGGTGLPAPPPALSAERCAERCAERFCISLC